MIKEFGHLTTEERSLLYEAPVIVSALAACAHNEINETKKNDAIRLAHLRAFNSPPILLPYYQEVEKIFKEAFEKTAKQYYPFDNENRARLKNEINKVNSIIAKLDATYAQALHKSLESYASHVKRSAYNVFQDFIFPMTYSRLNK